MKTMNCRFISSMMIFIITQAFWVNPISAWGSFEKNGIYYELNDDNHTAEVCSNPNYYSGEITIPASIYFTDLGTFNVTSIGQEAFNNCTGLTEVHLPKSLKTIRYRAFERCTGLTSVYFNEGLTEIGDAAFRYCSNLTTLYVPNSVNRIGDLAFSGTPWYNNQPDGIVYAGNVAYTYKGNMPQGTAVQIKEGTIGIGSFAFWNCSGMTSLTIPNSLTTIGFSAFSGCSGLKSVIFPNSIVSIDGLAFFECTSLTSLTIPSSVTSIGKNAFSKCWGLTSITVDNSNPYYDSRNNCNAIIQTENNILISGCKNTVIPSSVTSIGNCAFQQCNGLSSITIPNGVEVIGSEAFVGCEDLTSVEISNSVSEIGSDAFQWCTGLTSFKTKSKTPPLIYRGVFDDEVKNSCTLYVPANSKTLYESAAVWSEFENIEEYYELDDLEVISSGYCGNSITYTIYNDWSMVISGTGEMDNFEFNYEEVHPVNRDFNWVRVKNLTIEEGVSSIGDYAFYGCHNLTSVTIPGSVSSIGFRAFADCPILTYLNINDLSAWCQLNFNSGSPIEWKHSLYLNWEKINDLVIPNEVTAIGNYTFYRCDNLTSVTIPSSVTSIGEFAFEYCGNLASVSIESCETEIGLGAFDNTAWWRYQQDGLVYVGDIVFKYKGTMPEGTEIVIEEGTIGILRDAFFDCSRLTSVTIPGSVANIGTRAFSDCTSLTSITMESETPVPIDYETFYNVDKEACTLYVPTGSKSAYESAAGWNEFQNIVEYTPAPDVLSTGSFGDNITYTIYSDMTMVISGTGAMKNCVENGHIVPFNADYYQKIKRVIIEEGITSIGRYAFWNFTCLTSVTIPNSVVSFGDGAFVNCIGLTSVDISNSVTTIGAAAFKGCTGLTSMTIPNSVTSIGSSAFEGCSGLISVTIPNGLINIGSLAFKNCIGLTSVTIPESVTSIGESAFSGCTGLTFVDIPNSVTSIGNSAFSGCTGLTSVEIPNSVTSIDLLAFAYCTGLTSVEIPNSVTSIGGSAFAGCANLNSIVVSADNSTYDSRDNCNAIIETSSNKLVIGCKNTVIPNSVTSIGGSSFAGCTGLATVDIPDGVTSIGGSAFSGCTGLTSITVEGGTPPSIGSNAFYNVNKSNCTLYVPAGSKTAYESASGWSEFLNIVEYTPAPEVLATGSCGDNVTYTIYSDMSMVISGTGAMWPYSSQSYNNYDIQQVIIEDGVTSIGNEAFKGCKGLTSVEIPNSVTSIGSYAFESCTGLTSVGIPNRLTTVGSLAFYGCTGLTSVTIPNSVTSIDFGAFGGCSGMTSLTVEWITPFAINEFTFAGVNTTSCTLYVPYGSKTSYENDEYWSEFENIVEYTPVLDVLATGSCGNNVTYTIYSDMSMVISGTGAMTDFALNYDYDYNVVIRENNELWTGVETVTIEEGVTAIGDWAFYGCTGLTSVTISNSVASIGEFAFEGSTSLASVTFPNSVTSIGDGAFYGCTGLTSVTIPNSVTSIGVNAFSGCTGLNSVTIGNSVASIGISAFYGCIGLASLTIPNSVTSIDDRAFSGCTGLTSITVDAGNTIYDSRNNCNAIIETATNTLITGCKNTVIPNSVTSIGESAFSGCSGLTSVTIPNSVTSIGPSAFNGCTGLTSVTIPNSVTSIGSYAFNDCTGLTSIIAEREIPASVSSWAFNNVNKSNCTLYVPVGSKSAYENTEVWHDFKNIVEYTPSPDVLATGSCGDNVTYTIYSDMTMVISGTGEMWDYSYDTHINDDYYQSIKSLIIEEGVTSIGEAAFVNCTSLTSITIPSSVSYIAATTYGELPIDFDVKTLGAFYGCSVLSSINVDAGNPTYDSRNNCNAIVITATNKLIVGCVNSVIENSITSIGESAFEKCYGLTTMNIPNSVTSLGKCAFRGCRDLNSVTIPNSISLINIFTFDNCPSLTTIYVEQKTPPTLVVGGEFSDLVFDKDFVDSGTLYVPAGSKFAYENAVGWCKFEHIVEYGEEPDTDISVLDNAIYVDHIEGRIGGTMDIPIKVKSSSPIDDFKFKMILPAGTTVNSWALSSNRLPSGATVDDHFSEQNIEGNTITLACMLNYNAATFTGNDGEIATVNVTFGENMEVGTYPIRLTGCNIGHIDLSDVKATLNLEDYVVGDANGDGRVRIGDASAILHYIVGYPSADFHEKAADVNGDGLIRIGDVSAVLKIIVGL